MWQCVKNLLLTISLSLVISNLIPSSDVHSASNESPNQRTAKVYLFWEISCPHCQRAKSFLDEAQKKYHWLDVVFFELSSNEEGRELFKAANGYFGIMRPGVPLIIVGKQHFVGFDKQNNIGRAVLTWATECRSGCSDPLDYLRRSNYRTNKNIVSVPEQVNVPFIGRISTRNLSLPALTITLAAVDGFNPCAMWVLVFLIGLLVGIENKSRMWILGGAFLFTSALVYFAFLAAWLNIFLLLGALVWVRFGVGLFSIASGAYYLREFALSQPGVCKVTVPGQKKRIMDALRSAVTEDKFLLALFGIIVLAAAVNLIELLCSAGVPALFTGILAMSNLSVWLYYLYLGLYILIFLIDDVIVFIVAMITLQATGLAAGFSHYSHLIGGLIMLAIGGLLLFKPDWLAFT